MASSSKQMEGGCQLPVVGEAGENFSHVRRRLTTATQAPGSPPLSSPPSTTKPSKSTTPAESSMTSSSKHLEEGGQWRVVEEAGENFDSVHTKVSEGIKLTDVEMQNSLRIKKCREELFYKATVAEQLENYEEMAHALYNIASLHIDLEREERDLLLRYYETRIGTTLQSLRLLKSMELKEAANPSHLNIIKGFIDVTENLLEKICSDAIELANKHLLPFSVGSETKGIYHKIIGDCSFLICQHKTRNLEHLRDIGMSSYEAGYANMCEGDICPSNPTRIALVINLSASYHALGFLARSVEFASEEFEAARSVRPPMSDDSKKMLDLLSENLERWVENGSSPLSSEQDCISQSSSDHGTEMRYELRSLLVHTEPIREYQDDLFRSPYISQPPTPTTRIHNSLAWTHLSLDHELPGSTDPKGSNQASSKETRDHSQQVKEADTYDAQQVDKADPVNENDAQQGNEPDPGNADGAQQVNDEPDPANVDDIQEVNEDDLGNAADVQEVNEDDLVNGDDGGNPLIFHQVERGPRLTFEEPPSWDDAIGNCLRGKKHRPSMKKKARDKGRFG